VKRIIAVIVLSLLASTVAVGQEKASVFGGWQYLSVGAKGVDRTNLPKGFDIDLGVNLHKNVAMVADFGLNSKSESATVGGVTGTATAKTYNFLFGPRLQTTVGKVTPFAEALVGVAHSSLSGSVDGQSVGSGSQNNFAFAFGGGLDVNATKNVAIRLGKLDYEIVKMTGGHLNNFRYATGVVFKF
jgi:opacity protein-like surface antigen